MEFQELPSQDLRICRMHGLPSLDLDDGCILLGGGQPAIPSAVYDAICDGQLHAASLCAEVPRQVTAAPGRGGATRINGDRQGTPAISIEILWRFSV